LKLIFKDEPDFFSSESKLPKVLFGDRYYVLLSSNNTLTKFKQLGLREDKQEPDIIHGDLEKAKLKTAKFLAELDLG
jgi:hypothetical protein